MNVVAEGFADLLDGPLPAIAVLERLDDPRKFEPLFELLTLPYGDSLYQLRPAVRMLVALDSPRAFAWLREQLGSDDVDSRTVASRKLMAFRGREAFELAMAALNDSEPWVRAHAASAIADMVENP